MLVKIISGFTFLAALTQASFIDYNSQETKSLRDHFDAIIAYTSLHEFDEGTKALIEQAASRNDKLALTMLSLYEDVHADKEKEAAATIVYNGLKTVSSDLVKSKAEAMWVKVLKDVRGLAACSHCKQEIDAYLQLHKQGKASVYGLQDSAHASRIIDSKTACFLKNKKLPRVLKRMELHLVSMYVRVLPHDLARHLQTTYMAEYRALLRARGVDLAKRARDPFVRWLTGVRAQVKAKYQQWSAKRHAKRQAKIGKCMEKCARRCGLSKRERLSQWLGNVKAHLKQKARTVSGRVHDHFNKIVEGSEKAETGETSETSETSETGESKTHETEDHTTQRAAEQSTDHRDVADKLLGLKEGDANNCATTDTNASSGSVNLSEYILVDEKGQPIANDATQAGTTAGTQQGANSAGTNNQSGSDTSSTNGNTVITEEKKVVENAPAK